MRPILLKGHERPLTQLRYNREGDLLFSASKDHKPTLWYADNGERVGTYNGHIGSVWSLDVDYWSTHLVTGSGDTTARLWDVQNGEELFVFQHRSPVRSVAFAHHEQIILTVNDPTMGQTPSVFIFRIAEDPLDQTPNALATIPSVSKKITTAHWGPFNEKIFTTNEDGTVRVYDVESCQEVGVISDHKGSITNMSFSKDQTMFITASADCSAKLYDTRSLQLLKTFQSDRPINAAAISPIMEHVIIGGGQEAAKVTTTSTRVGKFDAQFFHMVYAEELFSIKGHFGPIHTIGINPDGRSFATGSEDGYIRLHHFDADYFVGDDL